VAADKGQRKRSARALAFESLTFEPPDP
jgi:hypothetical protein